MTLGTRASARERQDVPRGFTLVELLVVVAIGGILAAVAVPSFSAWYHRARVEAHAARFASSVSLARSAAMKFGTSVVLCASEDGTACDGSWQDGWIVFRDDDEDDDVTAAEPLLVNESEADATAKIVLTKADGTGTGLDKLAFDYRGYPASAATFTATRGGARAETDVSAIGQALAR